MRTTADAVESAMITAVKPETVWLKVERYKLTEIRHELMTALGTRPTKKQAEERRKARRELRAALGFEEEG